MPGSAHFQVITVGALRYNRLQGPGEATRRAQAVAVVARDKVALYAFHPFVYYVARLPHTLVNVIVPATTSILMSNRLISTLKLLCVMLYWCLQENSPSAAVSVSSRVFNLASYFWIVVSSSVATVVASRFWPSIMPPVKVRPSMPPPLPYVGDRLRSAMSTRSPGSYLKRPAS